MTIKHGFVATPAGRIHYLEAGSGRPLVLLHSNGCSAHEFADTLKALSGEFRVIAWDQPGQGDSDPITRHYSIEDYARAVVHLLDALKLDRVALAGASAGGYIAVAAGAMYRERFEKLVVVEAPLHTAETWETKWSLIEGLFSIPTQTFEQVAPRFRALTAEFHTRWNMDRNKAGGWNMIDVMWAMRDFDCLNMLARLTVPTLALIGDKGPVMGSLADYQRILPLASVQLMADCGHFPMIDAPAEFASHLAAFLSDRRGRRLH